MAGTNNDLSTPALIIIGLICFIVVLIIIAIIMYWYKRYHKQSTYRGLNTKQKTKLKIKLPDTNLGGKKVVNQPKYILSPSFVNDEQVVKTPDTPMTSPNVPFADIANISPFKHSLSVPSEATFAHKDRDADGLWKLAVKKATASQFFATKPKTVGKTPHSANGKIKFSLLYNHQGQKELTVKVCVHISHHNE